MPLSNLPSPTQLLTFGAVFALSPLAVFGQAVGATDFAAPSRASGQTLFTELSPNATGIVAENAYDDPLMWGARYREYMGGSMGSGVAAGDFDGDGKVDLYVSTKTKPGVLYRNLGNWKFEDVTEDAGLSEEGSFFGWIKSAVSDDEVVWRHGAVFADVDNDGLLDLYVCRNGAANFLYMNQGDGTFEEEAEDRGLAIADGSVIGAFADYDRDGWLDMLLLTNQMDGSEAAGRRDRLFRNKGNGAFEEVTEKAGLHGESFGHSVTWFDYDNDQWLDFYIANDYAGSDYLYRNNGDGTFTDVINNVAPHTSYSSMGADSGDINNDGFIDFLMGDMAGTSRQLEHRRKPAISKEDALRMGNRSGIAPQYTRNSLLLNTGLGYFREAAPWAGLEATDWTWSLRFEDFDNDGWIDLHVTNGMVREANNSDILSTMVRAFSEPQRIAVMKRAPRLEESNLAYRNKAGLGFEEVTSEWGLAHIDVSFGAATADFDNDGDLDLAYINHNGGVSVYRNDVSSQNRIQIRLQGQKSNRFGIGAIVQAKTSAGLQTRTLSTSRGYSSGSEIVAHFGLGSDTKVESLTIKWPSGIQQSYTNLDANKSYKIVETQSSPPATAPAKTPLFAEKTNELGLLFEDTSALDISDKEQALLPFRTDRRGPSLAIADLDKDGYGDAITGATTGSPARTLRWQEGSFHQTTAQGIAGGEVEDGPSLVFDADGNGTLDLLVTKSSANASAWPQAYQPVLYSNDGKGNFSATSLLPKVSINAGSISAADIDADGDLDIFIGARSIPGRYPETPDSIVLVFENGRYLNASANSPALSKVGLVKSSLFSDVDQDGLPDLIVAAEWDYVRYFHNEGDAVFSDRTEEAGFKSGKRGWWNGLASADFNGDGRMDFAAGNLGLNTTYRASPEEPTLLYYGNFFGVMSSELIIEAGYDHGELYPLRAKGELGASIVRLLRKYPKNDDYATATLTEVFGEKELSEAEVFRVENFSSGVFLSQENGAYRFKPFPRMAQIGPMQGIVATDMDGDFIPDVVAVQNTDIDIPSFHGGVGILLKGKSDGAFDPIEPVESGVFVPGYAKALTILSPDRSAKPSLFLSRHGDSSMFLENQTAEDRWTKIVLEGAGLNAAAVGARIAVTYSDGETYFHESHLGGGWLSQSEPAFYLPQSENKRIERVVVNWPNGQESIHPNPPANGVWKIQIQP